jgi:transcriptional activator SPT7
MEDYHQEISRTPLQTLTETEESQVIHDEIDIDKGELQNKIWREVTKKTRADLTTHIEKQYQFEFSSRLALNRNPFEMEKFSLLEHLHHQPETTKKLMRCSQVGFKRWLNRRDTTSIYDEFDFNSEDEEGFDGGFFFSSTTTNKQPATDEEDVLRTDLFLPEYYLNSGVPDIEGIPEEYIVDEEQSIMPFLDIYPTTQLNTNVTMNQNINALHTIRSIHDKCFAIQHNLPLQPTHIDVPLSPDMMMDIGTPIPNYTRVKPPLIVPEKASHQIIQRSVVQLLSHAGFETAQTNALNTLTDLVSDYFLNIGKTLRKYIDQHGTSMPFEDIVSLTLKQNGVNGVQDLDDYTQDIQHYGTRLNDIQCKLENTYQGLISVSQTK